MKTYKRYLSLSLLLLASLIWGFAFSAQKAAERVAPFTLGAMRSIFASLFLIFAVIAFDRASGSERRLFSKSKPIDINKTELIGGIICGLILALASFFQQYGINSGTDAGKASFITALYVVFVPIYAIFMKKGAPINVWLSLPIAVVGFYFLCITGDFKILLPDLFVFICALIFPFHILTIDRFSPRCDGVRMSLVQFLTASVANTLFALIFESPIDFSAIEDAIFPIIFLGIGSSGIAYTLQMIGQRGINPAAASIILSLESVFGVIGSVIFLGERMTPREYLGCAIVFLAVILSQIDFPKLFKK